MLDEPDGVAACAASRAESTPEVCAGGCARSRAPESKSTADAARRTADVPPDPRRFMRQWYIGWYAGQLYPCDIGGIFCIRNGVYAVVSDDDVRFGVWSKRATRELCGDRACGIPCGEIYRRDKCKCVAVRSTLDYRVYRTRRCVRRTRRGI